MRFFLIAIMALIFVGCDSVSVSPELDSVATDATEDPWMQGEELELHVRDIYNQTVNSVGKSAGADWDFGDATYIHIATSVHVEQDPSSGVTTRYYYLQPRDAWRRYESMLVYQVDVQGGNILDELIYNPFSEKGVHRSNDLFSVVKVTLVNSSEASVTFTVRDEAGGSLSISRWFFEDEQMVLPRVADAFYGATNTDGTKVVSPTAWQDGDNLSLTFAAPTTTSLVLDLRYAQFEQIVAGAETFSLNGALYENTVGRVATFEGQFLSEMIGVIPVGVPQISMGDAYLYVDYQAYDGAGKRIKQGCLYFDEFAMSVSIEGGDMHMEPNAPPQGCKG